MKKTEKFYELSPTERTIYTLCKILNNNNVNDEEIKKIVHAIHDNRVDRMRQNKLIKKILE